MQTLERPSSAAGDPRPRVPRPVLTVAGAVVGLFALLSVALLIYTAGSRSATTRHLEIAPGTATAIAAGENPLRIPSEWDFVAGDRLVLVNRDDADHWIGQWHVPAGAETTVELQPVYAGVLVCSVHPDGSIAITVEPAGFDWRLPLVPSLLLGIPLGLVLIGTRRVVRAVAESEQR